MYPIAATTASSAVFSNFSFGSSTQQKPSTNPASAGSDYRNANKPTGGGVSVNTLSQLGRNAQALKAGKPQVLNFDDNNSPKPTNEEQITAPENQMPTDVIESEETQKKAQVIDESLAPESLAKEETQENKGVEGDLKKELPSGVIEVTEKNEDGSPAATL